MKFVFVLLLIALVSVSGRKELPTTPKAGCLANHFGTAKRANVYGPKGGPTTKLSDDGVLFSNNGRRVYQSDVGVKPDEEKCRLNEKPYFQICSRIKGCDLCTASPHCGWCEIRGECMPSNNQAPSCSNSCSNDWIFNSDSCQGTVHAGQFTNVAPEAEKLITPEGSDPKLIVNTTKHTPGILKHHTQVGVDLKEKKIKACDSATGQTSEKDVVVAEPKMGDIDYPVIVKTHHKHTVNLKTGTVTDEGENDEMKYFGIDTLEEEKEVEAESAQIDSDAEVAVAEADTDAAAAAPAEEVEGDEEAAEEEEDEE
eukprot:CAMPEP_0114979374 /NCGR_PEP_ID=MMETSP0216-20121206/4332_1 /TAXON_ID=223996 /ORGANISM="Protocruzia adherens, Strain Boccale" /LENGTH=311 /DNA_ID=CAMNT_0002340685 /DNA_START=110 /DNA_END=1045 /DNA_ORIENTATION=-